MRLPLAGAVGATSTSDAEVEQHGQQVGVVHNPVAVGVLADAALHAAELEQHCQQVGIVDTAVAVDISVMAPAPRQNRQPDAELQAPTCTRRRSVPSAAN
jgi:hypothetical protein